MRENDITTQIMETAALLSISQLTLRNESEKPTRDLEVDLVGMIPEDTSNTFLRAMREIAVSMH